MLLFSSQWECFELVFLIGSFYNMYYVKRKKMGLDPMSESLLAFIIIKKKTRAITI